MNPELLQSRTALRQPGNVRMIGRANIHIQFLTGFEKRNRGRDQPLSDFRMAVGKGNASRPVVLAGRVIKYPGLAASLIAMRINRCFLLLIGKRFR